MKGCIHIYCGDGKGKTTAALGLSLRAAGNNRKVLFVQFLKGRATSELEALKLIPNITVCRAKVGEKFTFQMSEMEKESLEAVQTACLQKAIDAAIVGECDLLVLDEILGAVNSKTVDADLLLNFVQQKPAELELVLTGRDPSENLLTCADYVSEICMRKHPYEQGIPARKGIEY